MRAASLPPPRLHLFVCANAREDSPLGPGCAARGVSVYDALKDAVARRGLVAQVWITKTHCLGICPKSGASVASYGRASEIWSDVDLGDVDRLLDEGPERVDGLVAATRELTLLGELQTQKVLDLARRLRPGLTLEDVQNPHDFPELDDPDWHYADGVLAGIKSAISALRAEHASRDGETR